MLNVVCIKAGDKYGPEYPNRLRSMVARHLSVPHRFLCLTDNSSGVEAETVALDGSLQGWWNKISLFRARPYGLEGRILFLDLDVVIVGSLDALVHSTAPKFIRDYCRPYDLNSSVFLIEAGGLTSVWEQFTADVPRRYRGDQDWITRCAPDVGTWPEAWVPSYKFGQPVEMPARSPRPALEDGPGADARIVVFHGRPKPHELDGWVKAAWN